MEFGWVRDCGNTICGEYRYHFSLRCMLALMKSIGLLSSFNSVDGYLRIKTFFYRDKSCSISIDKSWQEKS